MKNLIAIMILSIFTFLGCKENDIIEPPIDTSVVVPVKVGNIWTYKYTMTDSLGNMFASFTQSTSIVSDTLINGRQTFLFSTGEYFWNENSGFWIQSPGKQPMLVYKYPANVGESYGQLITVIFKDSIINTLKGNFNCYGYSSGISITCVAPGIGKVKSEYFQNRSDGSTYLFQKEELISFQIK